MYANGYAPKEAATGDAFGEQKSAMSVVGPWAIAVYGDKVDWGVVPVPTKQGMDPGEVYTFTDAKNIGLYSACKNQKTAWDLLKYATSKEQDGKLLEMTGQMPIRTDLPTTYADYFRSHPEYKLFADQASRTVEVPNVPNSVQIWQEIRDAYSAAVIFGKKPVDEAVSQAAAKADDLAGQS
jgi:multiple sugar transport system substrate-binding protein